MAYITGFPSNSNITTTLESVSGNLSAGGILTNNLYYANGQPWNFGGGGGSGTPGGSNTQIQFNNQSNFGGSANLTYDVATNNMTLGLPAVVESGFSSIPGSDVGSYISAAGGVMILGSGTNILRSTNGGTTWATISTASANAYSIDGTASDNNSTFIAVTRGTVDYTNYSGAILRSTDLGLTWTSVGTVSTTYSYYYTTVRYLNNTWFVIPVYKGGGSSSTNNIYYYSTNGTTWSQATITLSSPDYFLSDITYDGTRYVISVMDPYSPWGTQGTWHSTTGTGSWTQSGSTDGGRYLASDGAGTIVATFSNNGSYGDPVLYSTNYGQTWTAVPNVPTSRYAGPAVFANNTWFIPLVSGNPYYSYYETTWQLYVFADGLTNTPTVLTTDEYNLPTSDVYDSVANTVLFDTANVWQYNVAGGSIVPGTGNLTIGVNLNIGNSILIDSEYGPANGIMLSQGSNRATWIGATNLFNDQLATYTGILGAGANTSYSGTQLRAYTSTVGNVDAAGNVYNNQIFTRYTDVNRWKSAVGNIYRGLLNYNYNDIVTVGWTGANSINRTTFPYVSTTGAGNAYIEYIKDQQIYPIQQGNNYSFYNENAGYTQYIKITDPDLAPTSFNATDSGAGVDSRSYSFTGNPLGLYLNTTLFVGSIDGPAVTVTYRSSGYITVTPDPGAGNQTFYYQTGYGLGNLLLTAVCWSSNSYVAAGTITGANLSANDNGAIIILNSADGAGWTQTNKIQTVGTFDNARVQDILWTGSELLLVGDGGAGSTTNSMIYRTANSQGGGTWTQVTTTGLTKLRLWQLMLMNEQQPPAQIVALGTDFTAQAGGQIRTFVYYSNTGGTSWTQAQVTGPSAPSGFNGNTIIYNGVPSLFMTQVNDGGSTDYINILGSFAAGATGTVPSVFRGFYSYISTTSSTAISFDSITTPGGTVPSTSYIVGGSKVSTQRFDSVSNSNYQLMLVAQTQPDQNGNTYPRTYTSSYVTYQGFLQFVDTTSNLPTDTQNPDTSEQPALFRLKAIGAAIFDSSSSSLVGSGSSPRNWIILSGHDTSTSSYSNVVIVSIASYTGASYLNSVIQADNGTGLVGQALLSQGPYRAPYWGNVATGSGGGGTPGGSNTQIQYNSSGSFAGSPTFTFDAGNAIVQVAGNVFATGFQANGAGELKISGSGNVTIRPRENLNGTSRIELRASDIYAGNIAQANTLGNITANYYYGNGTQLSNVATTNWTTPSSIAVNSIFTAQFGSTVITTLLAGQTFTVDNNLTVLYVYNSDNTSVTVPTGTYRCLGFLYIGETNSQGALFTRLT